MHTSKCPNKLPVCKSIAFLPDFQPTTRTHNTRTHAQILDDDTPRKCMYIRTPILPNYVACPKPKGTYRPAGVGGAWSGRLCCLFCAFLILFFKHATLMLPPKYAVFLNRAHTAFVRLTVHPTRRL